LETWWVVWDVPEWSNINNIKEVDWGVIICNFLRKLGGLSAKNA
jgi:hypothetical protein